MIAFAISIHFSLRASETRVNKHITQNKNNIRVRECMYTSVCFVFLVYIYIHVCLLAVADL